MPPIIEIMTDPPGSRATPERAIVELALRVADHQRAAEPTRRYWIGTGDALRWTLGRIDVAPVSRGDEPVHLDDRWRRAVRAEAETADACTRGSLATDTDMDYLTGAEST